MYNPALINAQFLANQLVCIGDQYFLGIFAMNDPSPNTESCVWKLARFIADNNAKEEQIDKEHIYTDEGQRDIATTFQSLRRSQVTADEFGRFVLAALDRQHNLIAYVSFDMQEKNSLDKSKTVVSVKKLNCDPSLTVKYCDLGLKQLLMLIICHCTFQIDDVAYAEISVSGRELSQYDNTGCSRQINASGAETEQYPPERANFTESILVWEKHSPVLRDLFWRHEFIFLQTRLLSVKLKMIIGN